MTAAYNSQGLRGSWILSLKAEAGDNLNSNLFQFNHPPTPPPPQTKCKKG